MKAQIKPHNGVPTLFLNEQPTFASHLWLSNQPGPSGFPAAECVRLFGEAGVHLYAFGVAGSPDHCGHWCGPREGFSEHHDFSMVEPQLRAIIKEDPQALFHLRLFFETAPWWNALHPEECELASDGSRLNQSYASEVWRQDVNDFLRAYLQHLKIIGMLDRVVAYQVQAGICGEWIKNTTSMQPLCGDYSEPMRRHFRSWLAGQYHTDAALQIAWADPGVTLATAEVPSAEQQLGARHHQFRDPSREQPVIDYYRCLAELVADDVIGFCRTVKELTNGEALAGVFFGYLMDLAWNDCFFGAPTDPSYSTIQRCGHLGLARVLRAPEVDYLVSPYGYAFRGLGGDGLPMPPSASVRLHGKLYLLEEDSHLHNEMEPTGRNFDRRHTIAINQREFNATITHGLGIWWFADWPAGSYAHQDPNFQPWLERFQKLGTWATQLDRSPRAEVAVLVDDEARRARLKQQIRRDGKTALWLYAPGYLKDTPALENMTDLTGFVFDTWDQPWGQLMHVTNYAHPITGAVPQDLFWGTSAPIGPLFHVDDPRATVLGQVVYTLGRCKPGFALKELDGWRSIYLASPDVPAPVLRGIHTVSGGAREFRLPRQVEVVYDLYQERLLARDADCFQVTLPPASSALYFTGHRELIQLLNPDIA